MPEVLVVDASAGIALAREEMTAPSVRAILQQARRAGGRLLVPSVFWLEIVNVLAMRYRLAPAEVTRGIVHLERTGLETVEPGRSLLLLTLDVVGQHRLAAYDAAYVALARALDGRLVTLDRTQARAAGDRAILAGGGHLLAEAAPPYGTSVAGPSGDWPGAAAYLRLLRPRRIGPTP